mgnify:CR=1 FL=1
MSPHEVQECTSQDPVALFSVLTMLENKEDHEDCEQSSLKPPTPSRNLGFTLKRDASCEESQ